MTSPDTTRLPHEMLFDGHGRGIYVSMKTAVRCGKERDVDARFSAMVRHSLFSAEFCNPASGWEKGRW